MPKKKTRRRSRLLVAYLRPGEPIQQDGIYRVFHRGHRLAHEVTLLAGNVFPRCEVCGEGVQFQLLRPAQSLSEDRDFRITLYQLPHPKEPSAA